MKSTIYVIKASDETKLRAHERITETLTEAIDIVRSYGADETSESADGGTTYADADRDVVDAEDAAARVRFAIVRKTRTIIVTEYTADIGEEEDVDFVAVGDRAVSYEDARAAFIEEVGEEAAEAATYLDREHEDCGAHIWRLA